MQGRPRYRKIAFMARGRGNEALRARIFSLNFDESAIALNGTYSRHFEKDGMSEKGSVHLIRVGGNEKTKACARGQWKRSTANEFRHLRGLHISNEASFPRSSLPEARRENQYSASAEFGSDAFLTRRIEGF